MYQLLLFLHNFYTFKLSKFFDETFSFIIPNKYPKERDELLLISLIMSQIVQPMFFYKNDFPIK